MGKRGLCHASSLEKSDVRHIGSEDHLARPALSPRDEPWLGFTSLKDYLTCGNLTQVQWRDRVIGSFADEFRALQHGFGSVVENNINPVHGAAVAIDQINHCP